MTSRSSMKLMIRMIPRHCGQAPIFCISLAQLFRYSFELLQFQLGPGEFFGNPDVRAECARMAFLN